MYIEILPGTDNEPEYDDGVRQYVKPQFVRSGLDN